MARLDLDKDKFWQTGCVVFNREPKTTIADVYFSSPEMGHRIAVDVMGEDRLGAFQQLHARLVLYGMTEVAKLVMEEVENHGEESE